MFISKTSIRNPNHIRQEYPDNQIVWVKIGNFDFTQSNSTCFLSTLKIQQWKRIILQFHTCTNDTSIEYGFPHNIIRSSMILGFLNLNWVSVSLFSLFSIYISIRLSPENDFALIYIFSPVASEIRTIPSHRSIQIQIPSVILLKKNQTLPNHCKGKSGKTQMMEHSEWKGLIEKVLRTIHRSLNLIQCLILIVPVPTSHHCRRQP